MPDPADESTFQQSRLDLSERKRHAAAYLLHQDLLRLRREDRVLVRQERGTLDGAVLGTQALVLRYGTSMEDERLLVVNLGADLHYVPAPEPLLAPVEGGSWILQWSSEHPRYGGSGIINPLTDEGWHIPAASATLFRAETS